MSIDVCFDLSVTSSQVYAVRLVHRLLQFSVYSHIELLATGAPFECGGRASGGRAPVKPQNATQRENALIKHTRGSRMSHTRIHYLGRTRLFRALRMGNHYTYYSIKPSPQEHGKVLCHSSCLLGIARQDDIFNWHHPCVASCRYGYADYTGGC